MSEGDEVVREPEPAPRRTFLNRVSLLTMFGGLAAGYGSFAAIAGRFLYPAKEPRKGWLYVATVDDMRVGDALDYRLPDGQGVTIARRAQNGEVSDFSALSNICPHLGCKAHWEAANKRFFCPCHNGAFDIDGKPIAGPPKDANQSLPTFTLKIESGLLYIEAPLGESACAEPDTRPAPPGPGHDPCLFESPSSEEV